MVRCPHVESGMPSPETTLPLMSCRSKSCLACLSILVAPPFLLDILRKLSNRNLSARLSPMKQDTKTRESQREGANAYTRGQVAGDTKKCSYTSTVDTESLARYHIMNLYIGRASAQTKKARCAAALVVSSRVVRWRRILSTVHVTRYKRPCQADIALPRQSGDTTHI